MTQISRPFQIALAAVVLLSAVWFIALRKHAPSGESASSSSAPVSAPAASASAAAPSAGATGSSQSAPGGGTKASEAHPTHGSAPGVEGLTRAIDRARGAVKQSEQNAQQLAQKSAQASSSAQSGATSAAGSGATSQKAAPASSPTSVAKNRPAPSKTAGATHAARTVTAPRPGVRASKPASAPNQQAAVEGELKQGRTVIVLFWSPRGSDDVAVRHQLAMLQSSTRYGTAAGKTIAVHYSSAAEVGQYGTITRSLQVFQTPTMLVIGPSGKTKTLTGLADSFAIQQAIAEARRS